MIEEMTAKVYRSPSAGRRYFTKASAISAEARHLILKRYKTEPAEYIGGACSYQGYYMPNDEPERYATMHRRLVRMIKNRL